MALALILLLALLLRLVNLNQSLWLDEAIHAMTVRGSFLGLFEELRGDFHPPLYHLLMWVWVRIFGTGEVSLRIPSVLFGMGTVFMVYLVGKEVQLASSHLRGVKAHLGGGTSLLAALSMATAPFHIYYCQEARMYAMTTFFASLSMYFFLHLLRNSELRIAPDQRFKLKVLYIISTVLLLYSDYYGFFVLLAQIIVSFFLLRKRFITLLPCYLVALLLFIPWLPMFWQQIQVGRQAIQVLPEWGRLVNLSFLKALPLTFIKFSIGRITIFNRKLYVAIAASLFLLYSLVIGKGFSKSKKLSIDYYHSSISLWLLIPILSSWLISLSIPNYQPFRLLICLPAFYLLLASGIFSFSSPLVRGILTLFILSVNLVTAGVYFFNPFFHREDWQGLVQSVENTSIKSSLALIPSESSMAPYVFYSQGKVPIFGNRGTQVIKEEDKERFLKAINEKQEVWYIDYLESLFDPKNLVTKWLDEKGYVKIRETNFNQILLLNFKKISSLIKR